MDIKKVSEKGLKQEYQVTVSAKTVEEAIKVKLTALASKVKIAGFRPGKVPFTVLEQRYGASTEHEVLEDFINKAADKVIDEHKLRPALAPQYDKDTYKKGGDFQFTLTVEVLPKLEKITFDDFKVNALNLSIDQKRVDEILEKLARDYGVSESIQEKRKSKNGDIVVIDFKGVVDGKPLKNGAAENYELTLGSHSFIEGFEEGLLGLEPGAEKELKLKFPKEYGAEEIAGKDVTFSVTVKEIRALTPAKLDDDLAKKLGYQTVADLTRGVEERLSSEYTHLVHEYHKQEILDYFSKKFDFPVPEGMADLELRSIMKQLQASLTEEEKKEKSLEAWTKEWKEEYTDISARRVRLGLILAEVANQNTIGITNEELATEIRKRAANFPGQEQKVFDYYRQNREALASLRAPILENKVIDFIVTTHAKAKKEIGVDELTKMVEDQKERMMESVSSQEKKQKETKAKKQK